MESNLIFVFGSNEAGRHGAGAARVALKQYGARLGVGCGHVGNSYAIPTKDFGINTLPIDHIRDYVDQFIRYARDNPKLQFKVTKIGCGLAGYSDSVVAPLFWSAPSNCLFDSDWLKYLPEGTRSWGTYGE